MGDTTIEWTDKTWNPVSGCTKVSQGCKHCYAERVFPRAYGKRNQTGVLNADGTARNRRFTDVLCHPERLDQPLHWKKPANLERASKILDGIPLKKRRCYTMIGYDSETPADAERRIERVFELGFMPFCQLYQPDLTKVYSEQWRKIRRKWSRPAAYMSKIPIS